jgi:hypothetical protein
VQGKIWFETGREVEQLPDGHSRTLGVRSPLSDRRRDALVELQQPSSTAARPARIQNIFVPE